jgi:hypothetical protein
MSDDGNGFPLKELHESIKRYTDAKMKAESYNKRLYEEAEAMFPYFVKYAKAEQQEKQKDLPSIIDNFYFEVLGLSCDSQDKFVRSSLTRKFKRLLKKHVIDDPRYQKKLDGFLYHDAYRQSVVSHP